MLQTWRWFGPDDPVSLNNVRQAGAVGIVSALHHMNQGQVWSEDEVAKRRAEIEAGGLVWSVVESIGVGEEIKTRSGAFRQKIDNYKQSIRNAARVGVKAFCYNFMAITDWTRTNLNWPLPNGGTALRFDAVDFAAYDLFILRRENAEGDYSPDRVAAAASFYGTWLVSDAEDSPHRNLGKATGASLRVFVDGHTYKLAQEDRKPNHALAKHCKSHRAIVDKAALYRAKSY